MKKQFESEIERVAPFREELKDNILYKAKANAKQGIQYRIVFSGFIGIAAICMLLFFGPFGGFDGGGNSATDIENGNGHASDEGLKPLTEIPILVKYSFDGETWITNFEIQKFLKETWNAIPWDPNAEIDIDTEYDYKIAMQVRRDTDAPVEELTFYLWYDGNKFIIKGNFGYGMLEGDVEHALASVVQDGLETWQLGLEDERKETDFDIIRYSIFDGHIVEEEAFITKIQTIFNAVEWMPRMEDNKKGPPDVTMRTWVKQHGEEQAVQKLVHFYIYMNAVGVSGELGEGMIHRDGYNDFITLLQEGGEQAFTVRTPANETERAEFQWILSQMTGVDYHYGNGATIVPHYALLIDGELHYFFEGERIGEVTHITQTRLNFSYSTLDGADALAKLRSYTDRDMQKLFAEVSWQDGNVSMTRQFDLQFKWEGVRYDVWLNERTREMEIVTSGAEQTRWALLDEKQSNRLAMYIRELGFGLIK